MLNQLIHPRRDYSQHISVWANECFDAENHRKVFMENNDFSDQPATDLCLSYGMQVTKKKPTYVVFDTETTGTSKEDLVIQMGYVVYDADGVQMDRHERVWQCDRRSSDFARKMHEISITTTRNSIYSSKTELEAFRNLVETIQKNNGMIVAHNAVFDTRMLSQTAAANNLDWESFPCFCTMKSLKGRTVEERGSNCKNEAVYLHLGGPPISGKMHTALNDATATAFIFFTGKERKWW